MKSKDIPEVPDGAVAAAAPCSLVAMEPGRRAVTKADLPEALENIQDGETVEVHHPESEGKPTNMGVVEYLRRDSRKVRVHAGCWGRVNADTVAWSYTSMGLIPANAPAMASADEKTPPKESTL